MNGVPLDLPLDIPVRTRVTLMPVSAAGVILDAAHDFILELIDTGYLVAWDIATPGSRSREIRIWSVSVAARKAGYVAEDTGLPESLLPTARPFVRSTELHRLFTCSQQHITALLDAGCITAAGPRQSTTGPYSFSRVSNDSICRWLRTRKI